MEEFQERLESILAGYDQSGIRSAGVLSPGLDMDAIECGMADGIVSFAGEAWQNMTTGPEPVVDMKLAHGGKSIRVILNMDMAYDMLAALVGAMRDSAAGIRE